MTSERAVPREALAAAVDAAFLGGIREDEQGPIPTYLLIEQELAARGYVLSPAPATGLPAANFDYESLWYHKGWEAGRAAGIADALEECVHCGMTASDPTGCPNFCTIPNHPYEAHDTKLTDFIGAAPGLVSAELDREPVGTETNCPLEGVHEHAFRGPHRFREWEPGT